MKGKPKGSYSFSPGFAEERDPASNNIRFQSSFSFSFGALPVLHARWLWRPAFFNCVCTNRWEVIRKRESWRCLGGLSESKIERQREGGKKIVWHRQQGLPSQLIYTPTEGLASCFSPPLRERVQSRRSRTQ